MALIKGGKLVLVVATTQNTRKNAMRREFERMRSEEEWAAMLSKTRQASAPPRAAQLIRSMQMAMHKLLSY